MAISDIDECYDAMISDSKEHMRDLPVVLRLMIEDRIRDYVPLLITKRYIEILNCVIDNNESENLEYLFNMICIELSSDEISKSLRETVIKMLLKNKKFVSVLEKLDCWYYPTAKKNEKSFLGMLISYTEGDNYTSGLKLIKRVIKKKK